MLDRLEVLLTMFNESKTICNGLINELKTLRLKLQNSNDREESLIKEIRRLHMSQMQPAVKYLENNIEEQLAHMDSELDEIFNEYYYKNTVKENINIDKLAMEVIDLQFSCQTMLEGALCLSKEKIADYIQLVVKKNKDRNYHIK